jgi:hypothetical protein
MSIKNQVYTALSRHSMLLGFAIAAVIIIGTFGLSYLVIGHGNLPIGWDTPQYIGQITTVASKGPLQFVQDNGFYNFMYSEIAALPTIFGVSPISVEIFFPIILAVLLAGACGYLAKKNLGAEVAIYTVLLCTMWFALYRIGTDLHPNLLALVIVIFALAVFPPWKTKNKTSMSKRLLFYIMIFLASLVHIESVLFLSFIIVCTLVIADFKNSSNGRISKILKDIIPLCIALAPSTILYYYRLTRLVDYSNGNPVFLPPLSIDLWLAYIGFLLPFAIYGAVSLFTEKTISQPKKGNSLSQPYVTFIVVWAVASIGIAALNYASPTLSIFSERALMLFPGPLLAALGLKKIIDLARTSHHSKRAQQIIGIAILIALVTSGWTITYLTVAHNHRVFISETANQRLAWLADHKFSEAPIFIFNDYDEYAGHLAKLNNDWVQALYGDHYSYVGRLDFLLAKQETPFESVTSQTISSMFIDKMVKDGIFNGTQDFGNHEIVVITDFYSNSDVETDYKNILNEISDGIYVVDKSQLEHQQKNHISFYSNIYWASEGWYRVERNWTQAPYALEYGSPEPDSRIHLTTIFAITDQGKYLVTISYWDGNGNDIQIALNNTSLGTIQYTQTEAPKNYSMSASLQPGVYYFEISLDDNPGLWQYACLDSLEVKKEA